MRKWNFLNAVAFAFLCSCSVIQKKQEPKPAPPQIKTQFNKIEIELAAGSTQKALKKLKKIAKEHVDTDIADDAWIMIGDIYYGKKLYQQSYDAYMNVVNSEYYSPKEVNALLGASNSLLNLGRHDESLGLVNKALNFSNTPLNIKVNLHEIRFSILDQLGDRIYALESLIFLVENTKDNKQIEMLKNKAYDYVESRMNNEELEVIAKNERFGFVRKYALFSVATTYFEQKDFSRAKDYYEKVIELAKDNDMALEAQKQIDQINARREVNPKTVGTILPLSGRHSRVAYKTLKGLKLGLGIYGNEPSNFKLAIIDSETNPDASRRAVERLVVEDHVIAIVGSLLSKTSTSVASKANELGVPVIGLSQKAGLTDIGDNVFRNALTSSLQMQALVKTAMEEQGLKKFAILYPNDAYGVEFANIFWDEVKARGGEIVSAQTYKPNETDFNGPIQRLVGRFYLEAREVEYKARLKKWYEKQTTISKRVQPPSDLLPPIVDFDAIFIPDNARAIGQIAPTLSYNDVDNVKLLGTNLWNNSEFINRGQKLVENALFVDTHLNDNKEFKNSEFYTLFRKTYGYSPGLFEAQAYDAGLLIRQMVISGETSRIGLRDGLNEVSNFNGSFGSLKMSRNRELSRPLVSLTVHQGEIMSLDKVPEVEKK